jgi:hypothetical protein
MTKKISEGIWSQVQQHIIEDNIAVQKYGNYLDTRVAWDRIIEFYSKLLKIEDLSEYIISESGRGKNMDVSKINKSFAIDPESAFKLLKKEKYWYILPQALKIIDLRLPNNLEAASRLVIGDGWKEDWPNWLKQRQEYLSGLLCFLAERTNNQYTITRLENTFSKEKLDMSISLHIKPWEKYLKYPFK